MTLPLKQLEQVGLFRGIAAAELEEMLRCLGGYTRAFREGEAIFLDSDTIRSVGVILRGAVRMTKEDPDGNRSLLALLRAGELFGETFACGSLHQSQVSFWAAADGEALFLPFSKALHTCSHACPFHQRLVENMVRSIGDKNVQLMEKIEVLSRKTLRDKILTCLRQQARQQGSRRFTLPFGRQELADYLCADRSALTRELGRMQAEGLLSFQKNTFQLPPEA